MKHFILVTKPRHFLHPPARRRFSGRWLAGPLTILMVGSGLGRAVVFYETGDPNYNTSATGTLAETAWSYQGLWGGFMGTAISSRHFLTARHVGGSVGGVFTYRGVPYTTVAFTDAPGGVDLRLWEVSGIFPDYAPLYRRGDEVGQNLLVIGRGTQRGSDVRVAGVLKGWRQGPADGRVRWGENQVSAVVTSAGVDYLAAAFNAGAGLSEAHLTVGDSGGGVFLQDTVDGRWKLAGISVAVDGLWSFDGSSGSGFRAAIFDAGGLYLGNDTSGFTFIADAADDIPSHFYAVRLSNQSDWMLALIPEPAGGLGLLGTGLLLWGFWCRRAARPGDTRP